MRYKRPACPGINSSVDVHTLHTSLVLVSDSPHNYEFDPGVLIVKESDTSTNSRVVHLPYRRCQGN